MKMEPAKKRDVFFMSKEPKRGAAGVALHQDYTKNEFHSPHFIQSTIPMTTTASVGTQGMGQALPSFILLGLFLLPPLRFIFAKSLQALMPPNKREGMITRQMTPIGRL